MSAVIVLPSIVPEQTRACLATFVNPPLPEPPTHQQEVVLQHIQGTEWHDGLPENQLVIVWNTVEHNLGVAGSWNIGISETLRTESDWVVILSAAIRFGPKGGRDFLDHLRAYQHAASPVLGVEAGDGLGWHLLAFPRHVLEKIGCFDTIFHPAYTEDLDYSRRIQLAYGIDSTAPDFVGPLWPKVDVDATLASVAHGIKQGGVTVDFGELERLYVEKWGAKSPDECFAHPYNDPELDWTFTGPAPVRP